MNKFKLIAQKEAELESLKVEAFDIVENNIVHHDALTYHYEFGEEKKRYLF